MEEKYLTKEGLENLKKELEYLKKEGRIEVSEELKEAILFGDLSENAAYDEAKEKQSLLESKIIDLERLINSAKVIEEGQGNGWVKIGSHVTLKSDNGEEKYYIVGEEEANPLENKISFKSPLGKELIDKPKGAEVEIKTPKGLLKYKILKID